MNRRMIAFIAFAILNSGCKNQPAEQSKDNASGWDEVLTEQIGLLGHRNWVVVADAAYPLQSHPAIQTVRSDDDHLTTVRKTYELIASQPHVRPVVYTDLESEFLTDEQVPGISDYKTSLEEIFGEAKTNRELHEEIIAQLDEAAGLYNVLIIKTGYTLPYTTVFFQLDCAYWGPDEEAALRDRMDGK